ncbi:MAG: hypothetical protein ACRD2F_14330 [Terriglobales bacterium]
MRTLALIFCVAAAAALTVGVGFVATKVVFTELNHAVHHAPRRPR